MNETQSPPRTVDVRLDPETAVDLAEYFLARNKGAQALQTLRAVLSVAPRHEAAKRRFAELHLALAERQFPPGSEPRGRLLLGLLGFDILTEPVETAYLAHLEARLAGRERLAAPGTLVLGLGSGRSGSTSLAALLAGAEGACATHENTPLVHWAPNSGQIRLHRKRFALLLERYPLVFDAAHWWLNAAEPMIEAFETVKLVALAREPEACARSFLKVKGTGRDGFNHWLDHDGRFWRPAVWDPLYPSYDPARFGLEAPESASPVELAERQLRLVTAYVEDYNRALARLAETLGARLLLLRTEELGERKTQDRILDFLGVKAPYLDKALNRGGTADGDSQALRC